MKLLTSSVEDIYSLSPLQESMLLQYILHPESMIYREQVCYRLEGMPIIFEYLQGAANTVVQQNEMLRTVFRWEGLNHPVQIVLKDHSITINKYHLRNESAYQAAIHANKIKVRIRSESINLTESPMDITLFELPDSNELVVTYFHILMDGWSNIILLHELKEAYVNYMKGCVPPIHSKTQYKQFIQWLKQAPDCSELDYWRTFLGKLPDIAAVEDRPDGTERSFERCIDMVLANKLFDFCSQHQVTPTAVLYTVWSLLIYHHDNNPHCFFGATVSGRNRDLPDIDKMIGLFINTIPFYIEVSPTQNVLDMINDIQQQIISVLPASRLSLDQIQALASAPFKLPVPDQVVVVQNYETNVSQLHEGEVLNFHLASRSYLTKINLMLGIRMIDDMILDFTFNEAIFSIDNIEEMAELYVAIMERVVHLDNVHSNELVDHILIGLNEDSNAIEERLRSTRFVIGEMQELDFYDTF